MPRLNEGARVRRALGAMSGLFGAALLAACGGGVAAVDPPITTRDTTARGAGYYFPPNGGSGWEAVAPIAMGWDPAALESAVAFAGARSSTALLVLYQGRIVAERYWSGWTPATRGQIASAGKSVASVMIGGLAAAGRLRLTDSVSRVVGPGWSRASEAEERRVTVRHLLSMTSGLDDSLRAATRPGERFYYNTTAYMKLFDVMERASGRAVNDVLRDQLSAPIGLQGAEWRPTVEGDGTRGYRLWMSARDMARFGSLIAAGGRWAGAPVLADTAYLAAMLAPQGADNAAYGYLWWLNGQPTYRLPGPMELPTMRGALVPSAPPDLVSALGRGDKKIYVSRALGVVVVRHGTDASEAGSPLGPSSFDEELWARLRAAMRY